MRVIQSIFFIILVSFTLYSCKDRAQRAKIYHETIGTQTAKVVDSVLDYGDALHTYQKSIIDSATINYLCAIQYHCSNVQAMEPFEGDTTLRNASVKLLSYYNSYLLNRLKPYVLTLESDSLSELQVQIIDSLYQDFFDSEKPFWQDYNAAEKAFGEKYDILSVK